MTMYALLASPNIKLPLNCKMRSSWRHNLINIFPFYIKTVYPHHIFILIALLILIQILILILILNIVIVVITIVMVSQELLCIITVGDEKQGGPGQLVVNGPADLVQPVGKL